MAPANTGSVQAIEPLARRVDSFHGLWVMAQRSPDPASVDLRQPSLIFAKGLVSAPLEAMSADVVRTPNARTGPAVTHEPAPDLHFPL